MCIKSSLRRRDLDQQSVYEWMTCPPLTSMLLIHRWVKRPTKIGTSSIWLCFFQWMTSMPRRSTDVQSAPFVDAYYPRIPLPQTARVLVKTLGCSFGSRTRTFWPLINLTACKTPFHQFWKLINRLRYVNTLLNLFPDVMDVVGRFVFLTS